MPSEGEIRSHAVHDLCGGGGLWRFIEYVTSIGYMPPWTPDPEYSHFVGEKVLTPEELTTLSDWVVAGKPEGDPAANPGLPDFPSGSQIGEPDHVLTMAEPMSMEGT